MTTAYCAVPDSLCLRRCCERLRSWMSEAVKGQTFPSLGSILGGGHSTPVCINTRSHRGLPRIGTPQKTTKSIERTAAVGKHCNSHLSSSLNFQTQVGSRLVGSAHLQRCLPNERSSVDTTSRAKTCTRQIQSKAMHAEMCREDFGSITA